MADSLDILLKGSFTTDAPDKPWVFLGTVEVPDKDKEKLSVDDIWSQIPVMKAISNGRIPITFGHMDLPVGYTIAEELVDIDDKGTVRKAIKLTFEVPPGDPLQDIARDMLSKGEFTELSISGIRLVKGPCDEPACDILVSKGAYRSFALARPGTARNPLARRLDSIDAPHIIHRAREHLEKAGIDGKCPLCNELQEYLHKAGTPDDLVRSKMTFILKSLDTIGETMVDEIKVEKVEPVPAQAVISEDMIAKAVANLLNPVSDRLGKIETLMAELVKKSEPKELPVKLPEPAKVETVTKAETAPVVDSAPPKVDLVAKGTKMGADWFKDPANFYNPQMRKFLQK